MEDVSHEHNFLHGLAVYSFLILEESSLDERCIDDVKGVELLIGTLLGNQDAIHGDGEFSVGSSELRQEFGLVGFEDDLQSIRVELAHFD